MRNVILPTTLLLALLLSTPFHALHAQSWADEVGDAVCTSATSVEDFSAMLDRYNIDVNEPFDPHDQGERNVYLLEYSSYCYGGTVYLSEYLLERGADPNLHREGRNSPLMYTLDNVPPEGAFRHDTYHNVVRMMINRGADVSYQNETTGRTPLMYAAMTGEQELVDLLLQHGASRSPETSPGWCISDTPATLCTAADWARLYGFVELALYLDGESPPIYRNTLHYAAKHGDTEQMRRLIRSGADVNEKEHLSKLTPLHYAVGTDEYGGGMEAVEILMEAGADPNVGDFSGRTPLAEAAIYGKEEEARTLIDMGARADNEQMQGCATGFSEYQWAKERGRDDLAEYMVEQGAINP